MTREYPDAAGDCSFPGPSLSRPPKPDEIREMIEVFKVQELISTRSACAIVTDAYNVLRAESTLVHIQIPEGQHITVAGDLHGQFFDLLHIFESNGYPSEDNPYLFNGDFVDRGSFSCEVILTLLAYKACFPASVFLARGNHETIAMNLLYGFEQEITAKYGDKLWEVITEVFCYLPLAHVINGSVFVVHGGIMQKPNGEVPTLSEIAAVDRVRQPAENRNFLMNALLWSDPQVAPGQTLNERGAGTGFSFGPDITTKFLEKNKLKLIIRSHECKDDGYEITHGGQLITVFSASNYEKNNAFSGPSFMGASTSDCPEECPEFPPNFGSVIRLVAPELKPEFKPFICEPQMPSCCTL